MIHSATIRSLSAMIGLFLAIQLSFAQAHDNKNLTNKGNIITSTGEVLNFNGSSTIVDGTKTNRDINKSIGLAATYFLMNQHGISGYFNYSRTYNKYFSDYSNDYLNRSKILYLGYTYAYVMQPSLTLYAQALMGAGAAKDKNIQRYSGNETIRNYTAFQWGMFLTLGAYVTILNNSLWYLNPTISYNTTRTFWDSRTSIYSNMLIQATVVAALTCNTMYHKSGASASDATFNRYRAGHWFMLATLLNPYINFGSNWNKFSDGSLSSKTNNSGGGINLGIGYYPLDFFAIIFAANLYANTQKGSISTDKWRSSLFFLRAIHHLPMDGWMQNFYALAFLKIGCSSSQYLYDNLSNTETVLQLKSSVSEAENTSKRLNSGIGFGIGYNYPIAEIVSVYGEAKYILSSSLNRNTDTKQKFRDTELEVGIRIDLK